MDNEIVLERYNTLPKKLQRQVLDFMDFLLFKYEKNDVENNEDEVSEEFKNFLFERKQKHLENPEKAISLEQFENNYRI